LKLNPIPVNNTEKPLGEDQCSCESTGTENANSLSIFGVFPFTAWKDYQYLRIEGTAMALLHQSF